MEQAWRRAAPLRPAAADDGTPLGGGDPSKGFAGTPGEPVRAL